MTNRRLCRGSFEDRLRAIAKAGADRIILREKDISREGYLRLAKTAAEICKGTGTRLMLNTHYDLVKIAGADGVQLPMNVLRALRDRRDTPILGASCHLPQEAEEAQSLGADCIIAGHIFDTDCKKGLPGRGLDFLREVCRRVTVPVFAIGGINEENIDEIKKAGASGACVMSSLMECEDPEELIFRLRGGRDEV